MPSNHAEQPAVARPPDPVGWRRWWVYQRERFPLLGHGPLIFAFSFCAVSLSHGLRGSGGHPSWPAVAVAFVTSLLLFFQLRVADEFKDFEQDSTYRPYRAVPRGLVKLRELAVAFVLAALMQLGLALALHPPLLVLLLATWLYLAAMSKEFFVGSWLQRRPILYMVSHMLIMPLIDLYATGTDWMPVGAAPPPGLLWFLAASYFNGMVIEIGRKIRSPMDEEHGVDTYSALLGRRRAVVAWWCMQFITAACALAPARELGRLAPVSAVLIAVLIANAAIGGRFLKQPEPGSGTMVEKGSGLWTAALYLGLGLAALWRA
jgi:4-hydroxybenzoate polyprenyltransferase